MMSGELKVTEELRKKIAEENAAALAREGPGGHARLQAWEVDINSST